MTLSFSRTLALACAPAVAAGGAFAADTALTVFDYAGFENPAFHATYLAQHGQLPTFTFFGEEDEALQKLVSGFRADVSHVCAGSVTKWIEADILEPWDITRIPEYANLSADLTGTQVAGDLQDVWFIPTDFGSTGIAYNADTVPAANVASLQVFHNPAYAGRLTLPDNVDDAYALAYLATGVTNWQNATDAEFEAASAWLRAAHENLRTYWTDPAELSQLLATGEVLIGWAWNETLPTMRDQGFPIGFQREAAEGSSLWLCGYVNVKAGQGSEDKAYDFINSFLDPAATGPLLQAGYGHSNAASMAAFGEELLSASGLGTISAPILAQLPMAAGLRERQSAAFERIKAGF